MARPTGRIRILVVLLGLVALVAIIALPVLAADPSGSPSPAASDPTPTATTEPTPSPTEPPTPTATSEPTPSPTESTTAAPAAEPTATAAPTEDADDAEDRDDETDSAESETGDEVEVTVTGTVGTRPDEGGDIEYTLTDGATVLGLDAGPSWYWRDDHPLKGSVGKTVTIVGEQEPGGEIEVRTVDGVRFREPGKPPWAGGWKVQGERHPGWSAEKAAKWEAKRAEKAKQHGVDCWPPGHCKDQTPVDAPAVTNPPGD